MMQTASLNCIELSPLHFRRTKTVAKTSRRKGFHIRAVLKNVRAAEGFRCGFPSARFRWWEFVGVVTPPVTLFVFFSLGLRVSAR